VPSLSTRWGALIGYTGRYGHEEALNNLPAVRLGGGEFWVGAGRQGSDRCYIVGKFGFGPAERQAVFASFAKHGIQLDPIVGPSDALLKQGNWYDMIEDYRFRTDERVMRAHLRTSGKRFLSQGLQHIPLELSLAWDKDDDAVKQGHCAG
jgi:hypothetical protein